MVGTWLRRLLTVATFAVAVASVISVLPSPILGATHTSATFSIVPAPSGVEIAPAYRPAPGVVDEGALAVSTPLSVLVGVASPRTAGLANEDALLATPGTLAYHHYLTIAEIAQSYGPSETEYASAIGWFTSHGLAVRPSPDRLVFTVSGPAGAVGEAFQTTFERYAVGNHWFYDHPTPATLPASVSWAGVLGLGNSTPIRPLTSYATVRPIVGPLTACPADASGLSPCMVQRAYNESGLLSAGTNGTGYRIAVIDAYDGAEPQSSLASDFASFTQNFSLPSGGVQYLYPVPANHNLNATSTGWGLEEALDMQWSRAIAPGARINMTFAPDPTVGLYSSVDWLVSHHAADILTMSWGENDVGVFNSAFMTCTVACNATSDGSYTLLAPVLAAGAAEGITSFSASGDCGAADGTNGVSTNYPASDPTVVGVGGTVLSINASTDAYVSEQAWAGNASGSSGCYNQGGSGGGYAPTPRPSWQVATGVPVNGTHRGVPDVSMVGGSPVTVFAGGSPYGVDGTSAASPMWAGVAALADQANHGALGFLDPTLYALARTSNYSKLFHDIRSGSNGYSAGKGWDPVTGLGTPNVGAIVPALSTGTFTPNGLSVVLRATNRIGPAPLTVTFHMNASGGTGRYPFEVVNFGNYNSSLAVNGSTSYTYQNPGVYAAQAFAEDSQGNESVSPLVAIVVGNGTALTVNLSVNRSSLPPGGAVTFTPTITGGTSPYRLTYAFGDGTYLTTNSSNPLSHVYGSTEGVCASVVVEDSHVQPNGGSSNIVALTIGGALAVACPSGSAVAVNLTASYLTADLPGDFVFQPHVAGGVPPYSVTYTTDDRYANACHCGIFSTPGRHTVEVWANDSANDDSTAFLNVTVLPAIHATFSATPTYGVGPLAVTFTAAASGGASANASRTAWTFGDGTNATGSSAAHTYTFPGFYVAIALLEDTARGNASEAFLIDVLPSASAVPLTATVTPAVHIPSGTPVNFSAQSPGTANPTFYWSTTDGTSAYGANVVESFTHQGVLAGWGSELVVGLAVYAGANRTIAMANATVPLLSFLGSNATVLNVTDSIFPTSGTTPLSVTGTAMAVGMLGVSYNWSLGDGTLGSGPGISHTYWVPGNWTAGVIVSDRAGDAILRTVAVSVTGSYVPPLVVQAGASPGSGVAPLNVSYGGSASGGAPGVDSYEWSFGDGTNSSPSATAGASHVYLRPGIFTAVLTARDSLGDATNASVTVTVYNVTPVRLALASAGQATAGEPYSLTILANASCGSESLPTCSSDGLSIGLCILGPILPGHGAQPAVCTAPNLTALTNGSGGLVFRFTAPVTPGNYTLLTSVTSPYYTGSNSTRLVATQQPACPAGPSAGPCPPLHPTGVSILPEVIAAAVAAVAIAALLVWFVRRRRPRPISDLNP